MIASDDAARAGLLLLVLIQVACAVAALKAAFFGFDLDLIAFWACFLVPITGPVWTIVEAVRSSCKTMLVCFLRG